MKVKSYLTLFVEAVQLRYVLNSLKENGLPAI